MGVRGRSVARLDKRTKQQMLQPTDNPIAWLDPVDMMPGPMAPRCAVSSCTRFNAWHRISS